MIKNYTCKFVIWFIIGLFKYGWPIINFHSILWLIFNHCITYESLSCMQHHLPKRHSLIYEGERNWRTQNQYLDTKCATCFFLKCPEYKQCDWYKPGNSKQDDYRTRKLYICTSRSKSASSAINTLINNLWKNSANFFFFSPFIYLLSHKHKLPKALRLHKSLTYFHNAFLYKQPIWWSSCRRGSAQQARGSGTGNRLTTGPPQPPETFKEAKRHDNLAIIGLAFNTLGTIASCLLASSQVPW